MEPVHIFYKELPAEENNIFTAGIAEKKWSRICEI